ncbi:MAG: hypothetical protein EZS28_005178 [Streblomastix strix]|uniref:Reverse transcriptase domain-containing protein n=1 Tax=Streblomastix strix TaxID=222440 RepID=A0A5J4WWZ1_9EUKA|nr:MAG: hypothetical protein EZS28_005178 [Streblomastix strix]
MPFGVTSASQTFAKTLKPVIDEAPKICHSMIFANDDDISTLNAKLPPYAFPSSSAAITLSQISQNYSRYIKVELHKFRLYF